MASRNSAIALVELALLPPGVAEVVVAQGVVLLQADELLVFGNGFIGPPEHSDDCRA